MSLTADERAKLAAAVAIAERRGERRRTAWCVVSGAPGSGKTTLARRLAQSGHMVVEDPARAILLQDAAVGIAPTQSRRDYRQFQQRVLEHELATMRAIDARQGVFFDYGVAESLAFLKGAGLSWDETFVEAAARFRFATVFVLEPLELDSGALIDTIRTEDEPLRRQLHTLILEVYGALGQRPVPVAAMPLQERLEFVVRGGPQAVRRSMTSITIQ